MTDIRRVMTRIGGFGFVLVSPVIFTTVMVAFGIVVRGGSARSHVIAFGSLACALLSGVLCLGVFAGRWRRPLILVASAALAALALWCIVPEVMPC